MNFPKSILLLPAMALMLFAAVLYTVHGPVGIPANAVNIGPGHFIVPGANVKFVKEFPKHEKHASLGSLFAPAEAEAAMITPTNTITPGANVNLQLASPQASAAYVACNFALSKVCKIYVNATISTFAMYNGTDGVEYTVEFVQDGNGHTVAAPTSGGTPAGISTQVAGWAAQLVPALGAVTAPTSQASTVTKWRVLYDSSLAAFLVLIN